MHGQARVKRTEAEKEKKKKEQLVKVKAYKEGMERAFSKRLKNEHDDEALQIIEDLLSANPDIYTMWNFRKEILLTYIKTKTKEELSNLLISELRLTEVCLRINPKSYGSWYHRLWLMNNMPEPNLNHELELCTKYLKLDARNFHCWDYRRSIVAKLGVQPEEELQYTMKKIEENFSNYSSWHYRSKLLPLVYPDPEGIRPVEQEIHKNELELVQSAAFTDPSDQSAWFYQRWLLGRNEPLPRLAQAVVTPEKIYLAFTASLSPQDLSVVGIPAKNWTLLNPKYPSNILVSEHDSTQLDKSFKLVVNFLDQTNDVEFQQRNDGNWYWHGKTEFSLEFSPKLLSVLQEQLSSCDQLLELEPDSKWTLLTSTLLMHAIDRKKYNLEIMERLKLLIKYDPFRKMYYKDLRSRLIVEDILEKSTEFDEFVLCGTELTSLYHSQYLLPASSINLSNNNFSRSLSNFYPLQMCKILKLDNNDLTSLEGFPHLCSLTTLSIKNNKITSLGNITNPLKSISTLISLDYTGNPIDENPSNIQIVTSALCHLTLLNGEDVKCTD